MQMSLNKHKRFTTHLGTHNKGSLVQLKLGEIYYKGLLRTTAKTGAASSGNSMPPSFPDRSRALRLRPVPPKSGNRFHRVLIDRADRTQAAAL
jgi:hypothetical protein